MGKTNYLKVDALLLHGSPLLAENANLPGSYKALWGELLHRMQFRLGHPVLELAGQGYKLTAEESAAVLKLDEFKWEEDHCRSLIGKFCFFY